MKEEKIKKKYLSRTKKNKHLKLTLLHKSPRTYKLLGCPSCRILWTILEVDEERTSTYRQANEIIMTRNEAFHTRDDEAVFMCHE